MRGLSPRMRGNRPARSEPAIREGSIPAYAGEPAPAGVGIYLQGVYPRVCGGTLAGPHRQAAAGGLSPRMRGNQPRRQYGSYKVGSIPAYAGEPVLPGDYEGKVKVYPRVCGGTGRPAQNPLSERGLSPRMRGNRILTAAMPPYIRSIPAYAGEPSCYARQAEMELVYPRVCGGTPAGLRRTPGGGGLSPRMRGNQPEPGRE